jgi:hypothetical protein
MTHVPPPFDPELLRTPQGRLRLQLALVMRHLARS